MTHFFYRTFVLFFLTQSFFSFSYAKEKLTYSRFPMVRHGKKFDYPKQLKVSGEKLNIKINPKAGTHHLLGIDQLYVSKNKRKKILVKQDVVPSSKKILNEWTKLSSGSVFHFEKNKKIIAVYAEGYHERALSEIERQFVKTKTKKIGSNRSNFFINQLFTCAYAEVAADGWSEDWNWQGSDMAPPIGVVDNAPRRNDDSGESLARCLLRQTGSSLYDMGSSAVDTVSNAASAVWNDPLGAARATGSYLYGVGESAVSGVYNAGSAVVSYCLDTCLDVEQMWADAGDAVDSMYQLGVQLVDRVSNAITGFADLPPAVKNRLICEVGGQMIANFGVNAVLSFLGGSAVAAPRIALMLNRLQEKIENGLGALMALGRSNLSVEDQQQIVTDYMKGNMSSDEILVMLNQNPANRDEAPEMSVAALSDPNTDRQPNAGIAPSMDSIEEMYAGQNITIMSKSGNTYSGRFEEFIRDAQTNEMVMVMTLPDGTRQDLRVDRLNLNTISGSQNGFTIGSGNRIQPLDGTALGGQLQAFQTESGMNLVLGRDNTNGTNGFHINYESKTVVIDQAVLNDPARLETLMSTTLPQAFRNETLARSNLTENHGGTVSPNGVLTFANPNTTLGRMVEGLRERGISVTINDPNLRSQGALGFARGVDRISIQPDLLLPGNEQFLLSVLRHEVRHTTTAQGSVRYPLVDTANPSMQPSATALAYAGRNIRIESVPGTNPDGTALQSAALPEIYSRGFRADEYDARLAQLPNGNLNPRFRTDANATIDPRVQRSGVYDDSSAFLNLQGGVLYQIRRDNTNPSSVVLGPGYANVTYVVERQGQNYTITIPLQGQITSQEQAAALAQQVINSRVNYLLNQRQRRQVP